MERKAIPKVLQEETGGKVKLQTFSIIYKSQFHFCNIYHVLSFKDMRNSLIEIIKICRIALLLINNFYPTIHVRYLRTAKVYTCIYVDFIKLKVDV